MRIRRIASGLDLQGDWNGEPVHFVVARDSIMGSAHRQVSPDDRSFEDCRYDLARMRGHADYAGHSDCGGTPMPERFELRTASRPDLDEEAAVLLIAYLVTTPA